MKLTIVIPAYNEEAAIGSTIERSLAAREHIVAESPVETVEVVVVSDGSTDRTADIARGYSGIRVIVFEQNRGYGAAIKRGFEEGGADLVGFLDADGTCDPAFFGELCRELIEQNAAVAIGSRMSRDSRMPALRRLGNRIYAFVLSILSNKIVTDTASGMRVIRRDVLSTLYPLPDGLHFTPAMSARVLMDDRLSIVERPMPYEERIGDSKLNIYKDGIRFFHTIFNMALVWQPAKMFIWASAICFLVMLLFSAHPIETWLRVGRLEDDVIYRLLFCSTLGVIGMGFLSAAMISHHVHRLIAGSDHPGTFRWKVLDRIHSLRGFAVIICLAVPAMAWLVGQGFYTWITAGYVELHWARVIIAGFVLTAVVELGITTLIVSVLSFHTKRAMVTRVLRQAEFDREAVTPELAPSVPFSSPPVAART